tara:strand:+ start:1076 stop:1369 length:294 start_codon:yes stop_codon:yes gene_type:complete
MEIEYKVIQSTTPHFAKTSQLLKVLQEESAAGWQLVEKFDNYKLRLCRDIKHRADDSGRTLDPYRTHVGPSNIITYSVAGIGTLALVLLIFRLVGAI